MDGQGGKGVQHELASMIRSGLGGGRRSTETHAY
jgi:hypothetical protein